MLRTLSFCGLDMTMFKVEKVNPHIAVFHLTNQQVKSAGSDEDHITSEKMYWAMMGAFDSPHNVYTLGRYEWTSQAIYEAVFASQKARLFKKVEPIQQVVFGTTTYMFRFDAESNLLKVTFMANIPAPEPAVFVPTAAPLLEAAVDFRSEVEMKVEATLAVLRENLSKLMFTKLSAEQEFDVERLSIACRTVERLLMEVSQFPSEDRKKEALLTAQQALEEVAVTLETIESSVADDIIREMKILEIYLNMKNRGIKL